MPKKRPETISDKLRDCIVSKEDLRNPEISKIIEENIAKITGMILGEIFLTTANFRLANPDELLEEFGLNQIQLREKILEIKKLLKEGKLPFQIGRLNDGKNGPLLGYFLKRVTTVEPQSSDSTKTSEPQELLTSEDVVDHIRELLSKNIRGMKIDQECFPMPSEILEQTSAVIKKIEEEINRLKNQKNKKHKLSSSTIKIIEVLQESTKEGTLLTREEIAKRTGLQINVVTNILYLKHLNKSDHINICIKNTNHPVNKKIRGYYIGIKERTNAETNKTDEALHPPIATQSDENRAITTKLLETAIANTDNKKASTIAILIALKEANIQNGSVTLEYCASKGQQISPSYKSLKIKNIQEVMKELIKKSEEIFGLTIIQSGNRYQAIKSEKETRTGVKVVEKNEVEENIAELITRIENSKPYLRSKGISDYMLLCEFFETLIEAKSINIAPTTYELATRIKTNPKTIKNLVSRINTIAEEDPSTLGFRILKVSRKYSLEKTEGYVPPPKLTDNTPEQMRELIQYSKRYFRYKDETEQKLFDQFLDIISDQKESFKVSQLKDLLGISSKTADIFIRRIKQKAKKIPELLNYTFKRIRKGEYKVTPITPRELPGKMGVTKKKTENRVIRVKHTFFIKLEDELKDPVPPVPPAPPTPPTPPTQTNNEPIKNPYAEIIEEWKKFNDELRLKREERDKQDEEKRQKEEEREQLRILEQQRKTEERKQRRLERQKREEEREQLRLERQKRKEEREQRRIAEQKRKEEREQQRIAKQKQQEECDQQRILEQTQPDETLDNTSNNPVDFDTFDDADDIDDTNDQDDQEDTALDTPDESDIDTTDDSNEYEKIIGEERMRLKEALKIVIPGVSDPTKIVTIPGRFRIKKKRKEHEYEWLNQDDSLEILDLAKSGTAVKMKALEAWGIIEPNYDPSLKTSKVIVIINGIPARMTTIPRRLLEEIEDEYEY